MLESADRAVSNTAVRKDVWVQVPPAAPEFEPNPEVECLASPPDAGACVDDRGLGRDYVYLLGLYLGDGTLHRMRRGVWLLRVTCDLKYPGIIAGCKAAIEEVSARRPGQVAKIGCVDVYSTWKHWPCAFPQRGPWNEAHAADRAHGLADSLVKVYPQAFLAGLIHSDGCRAMNKVKHLRNDEVVRYEYPRYFFSNRSADIRELFIWACGLIGVQSRQNNAWNISVAKRASVEILDSFIGPKR